LKHGFGTDKFANGDTYSGEYRYGKPYGRGRYIWRNGSQYEGDFVDGMKQGKGVWSKGKPPKQTRYEGEYQQDKKHGWGKF